MKCPQRIGGEVRLFKHFLTRVLFSSRLFFLHSGHSKAFGISKELQTTAAGTDYSEKGTKPQGIFGLMDVNEIPGFTDDGKQASVDADGKKKKKKKKTKKSTKKTKTKMVQKVQIAGIF